MMHILNEGLKTSAETISWDAVQDISLLRDLDNKGSRQIRITLASGDSLFINDGEGDEKLEETFDKLYNHWKDKGGDGLATSSLTASF